MVGLNCSFKECTYHSRVDLKTPGTCPSRHLPQPLTHLLFIVPMVSARGRMAVAEPGRSQLALALAIVKQKPPTEDVKGKHQCSSSCPIPRNGHSDSPLRASFEDSIFHQDTEGDGRHRRWKIL
jgi:hypothetical protein